MADGLISMLLNRLTSTAYEYVAGEVKLVLNVTKEVDDFAAKLIGIQAVLEDAERRQVKEAGVRIWLDKLKNISFEMVDVLEEWNTDVLRQQVEQQEREAENAVVLEKKKKKKVTFSASSSCFCFRKAREVFGREKEKDFLITKLLSDGRKDHRGVLVIPVLGMGGMDPFDVIKIAKAITGDNTPSSNDQLSHVLEYESKAFEDVSKKMVEKCKGLPLATKALGSLMRNKRTKKEWLGVLNSKIWDREEMEQKVFQPLLLSYYDLAPSIKSCLLYCASFSKDYEFEREKLINLWMAQDYLNSKENKDKGEIGEAFFDNLVARSFFQDFKKSIINGKIVVCKMHDIIHDFVQSLTKNECLIIDAESVGNEIKVLGERIHHLALVLERGKSFKPSSAYHNCKNLRTLTILYSSSGKIDSKFVLQQKCLRTLNLSRNNITEVPKEIGELIHLKHIDLSSNVDLKILPDSICGLYNLYILHLNFCLSLEKLPDNMGKVISLKHLYLSGCVKLEYLPKGIRRLKKLKKIDQCLVFCGGEEDTAALQLGDLELLNFEGDLYIEFKGNVEDKREIEKVQLWKRIQLIGLKIYCLNARYKQTRSTMEILNILRPHENLDSLSISFHSGKIWPSWFVSLHNLRKLDLFEGNECKYLPPLGKLLRLEELILQGMRKVKKVSGEFLGIDKDETSLTSSPSSFFPKLKKLEIRSMDVLEEWESKELMSEKHAKSTNVISWTELDVRQIKDCQLNSPSAFIKPPKVSHEMLLNRESVCRFRESVEAKSYDVNDQRYLLKFT
ncbi:unnamed protein product [Malus baccata var. baccata]